MAIRRVIGSVLSTISEGRGGIKAIASIESQERERKRGDREGKKSKKGNRLCYLAIAYM